MHCSYQRLDDGRLHCKACGDTTTRRWGPIPRRMCGASGDVPRIPEGASDHASVVQQALATVEDNPLPIGDWTATALDALGITKERVSAWWGEPCPCPERQQRLNELGRTIVSFLKGAP